VRVAAKRKNTENNVFATIAALLFFKPKHKKTTSGFCRLRRGVVRQQQAVVWPLRFKLNDFARRVYDIFCDSLWSRPALERMVSSNFLPCLDRTNVLESF